MMDTNVENCEILYVDLVTPDSTEQNYCKVFLFKYILSRYLQIILLIFPLIFIQKLSELLFK